MFGLSLKDDDLSCVVGGKVYLSGCYVAKNGELLDEHNISRVVRIGTREELDHVYGKLKGIVYLDVELDDSLKCHITKDMFDKVISFIDEVEGPVLVHCHMGVSRSAAFVIAYIAKKFDLSLKESRQWVKDIRPSICPNSTFQRDLITYYVSNFCLNTFVKQNSH